MDASGYNAKIYCKESKFNGDYYKLFGRRAQKIIKMLDGFHGKMLDVGCGDATMTLMLRDALGCEVKAVELIKENVEKARVKGIDAKQVDLNSQKLPFKDGCFDCVFAGEVLEHVVDSEGLLSEMRRVLRDNGTLLLTVPNVASWYNRFLLFFGYLPHFVESGSRQPYGTPFGAINGHVKAFTKKSIVQMLGANGFEVKRVAGSGFSKTGAEKNSRKRRRLGAKLFFAAEKVLDRKSSLATNIIVKATKK